MKMMDQPILNGMRHARMEVRVAGVCGMDGEAEDAFGELLRVAGEERVGVAGRFMMDGGVSGRLRELGVVEGVEEADFFQFQRIVIPYDGVVARLRKEWEQAGHRVLDLTSAQVRRAQVALGLLGMEGAQRLVIGPHEDGQVGTLCGGNAGTKVIEDTTDTARLVFSPHFGAVCHTRLSPRRVSWLVQQLRLRYRDARVTFLDTVSPSVRQREQALEKMLAWCDGVVVVGERGEVSCEALAEVATRAGKAVVIGGCAGDLEEREMAGWRRVAVTAGGLVLRSSVEEMVEALRGG